MATISVPAITTLKDVLLTLGDNDFQKQVSAVAFVPSSGQVQWQGMSPDAVITDVTSATWVVNITLAQDWEDPNSLCNYLLTREGERVPCRFEPVRGGAAFTADVTITPGQIGGQVNNVAEQTVSLGSSKPTRVIPAP